MTWRDDLITDLKRDEGLRLEAYMDGVRVWTLGYGHTRGVKQGQTCTREQALIWLHLDLNIALEDLGKNAPWALKAPERVQRGLGNMCFNLGWARLSGFASMLAHGAIGNWQAMADEAMASKWALQVGARALRISNLFRTAEAPSG